MSYRLTRAAQQDIREIARHIRLVQKSPQNAALVLQRLTAAFRSLARTPSLGHRRQELDDEDARVLPVTGVVVIYDPHIKPLTILRVIHGARDLGSINPRQ